MDALSKLLEAHPELVHIQSELSEWLKDYEALVEERAHLQKELDQLRATLDEPIAESD